MLMDKGTQIINALAATANARHEPRCTMHMRWHHTLSVSYQSDSCVVFGAPALVAPNTTQHAARKNQT